MGIMTNETVMTAFASLGLDEEENLFDTLDADRCGAVTFQQFFDGVMLVMKGHETAKAKDMVATHLVAQSMSRRVAAVESDVRMMQEESRGNMSTIERGLIDLKAVIAPMIRGEGVTPDAGGRKR